LIGGSVARAAKKNGLCSQVIGHGRHVDELDKAISLGVIDQYELDIASAVRDADLIIVAVPLGIMTSMFEQISGHAKKDAVISDVGSSKVSVISAATTAFGELPPGFVPGHPIAGTEKSGVEASFAELFEGRCCILTPVQSSAPWAVDKLTHFWEGIGSEVVAMEAQHHDEVLAATSHVPHVLAFALVDTLGQMHERKEIFKYAAGGFRDFTRIASSDPDMWRDICLSNSDAIKHVLHLFKVELESLEQAIDRKDGVAIENVLQRAKNLRDSYVVKEAV